MVGNEFREKSFLQSCLDVLCQSILLIFLFISPWFYGLTRFRDELLAEIFIFSLFLGATLLLDRRKNPATQQNAFDYFILLCLGLSFIYVVFSELPYQSLLAFLQLLSCVLFYRLIRSLVRTWNRFLIFLWAILAIGFFYSVYGLLQYQGFLPHAFWYQPNSLASRYVNSGHFGVFLLFSFFIAIPLLVSSRKVALQLILTFLLTVMGCALILSRARAVWLAFLVGLVVFLWQALRNQLLDRRASFGIFLLTIGGAALLFLGSGMDKIVRRFGELWLAIYTPLAPDKVQFYSLLYRRELWKGALQAIREQPWGWGLGTFSSIFPRYRVHSDRFWVDYAHNEFLQVGVDLGIPGLLLLIGFLWIYLQRASSFLGRREVPTSQKAIGAGFLALYISLALVSQVDFPLRIYATGILFATFLGLSAYLFESPKGTGSVEIAYNTSRRRRRRSSTGFFEKYFWIIPWVLVLVSNLLTVRQLFAELHSLEGKRIEKSFSWKEAQVEYEKAALLSPWFGHYHEALGSLYDRRAGLIFNETERKNLLQKALHAYQQVIRLEPYRALPHYLLAQLYEEEGDSLHAQSEFLKAIALEPTNSLFVADYGHFAVRHSLVEEAIGAFEKVKNLPFREDEVKDRTDYNEILRICYRLTQDYNQLRRVIPDDLGGHTGLAHLLAENGRWDLARKEFEALTEIAKRMYPDYRQYFENVGRHTADFYLSHNRLREALEIYREAATTLPHDEVIKRKIGEIRGHFSGA